jgi:hypothetical protein
MPHEIIREVINIRSAHSEKPPYRSSAWGEWGIEYDGTRNREQKRQALSELETEIVGCLSGAGAGFYELILKRADRLFGRDRMRATYDGETISVSIDERGIIFPLYYRIGVESKRSTPGEHTLFDALNPVLTGLEKKYGGVLSMKEALESDGAKQNA